MKQVRWRTHRKGNTGHVLEEHFDTNGERVAKFDWELPANCIPAFLEGRRRVIAMVHDHWNPDVLDEDLEALFNTLEDDLTRKLLNK
jgi:hypothetical protein